VGSLIAQRSGGHRSERGHEAGDDRGQEQIDHYGSEDDRIGRAEIPQEVWEETRQIKGAYGGFVIS
jgi:hypothetical protein